VMDLPPLSQISKNYSGCTAANCDVLIVFCNGLD